MSDTIATTDTNDLSLSLTDIQNALQVIDFAADQGAFKGWATIQQVLSVRNRLNAFLDAAAAASAPAEGEAAVEAETVEAETVEG
jgi:hypothetical protein